ncbi:DUF1330 domain-containing protein [Burkholderia sp. L27(2015)]|uniref:DUF1330 domain-containing protein n=1 Tax=Burkholderia sp. L27(2015) TaxID=1641858 RepID=UPI00131AB74A|nr:DUF1330 domain-containing protein [Burkholderia sp. L27(2015)]
MVAYVVVQEIVEDETKFSQYREKVMPILEQHGGRFLVRGGNMKVVEGEWPYPRLVILEFPTREAVDTWYSSPEYQAILPLRLQGCKSNLIVVDGI